MTSFTWKRKAGEHVRKDAVIRFGENAHEETIDLSQGGDDVFGTANSALKRPKTAALEDRQTKARRLKDEGCVLSENERYWEALKKWDEAILLCPEDETLHEMKAQVLMELRELYPAIQSAKHAVKLRPTWWVAHQTLGRAQLSIGEVQLAIRSFSEACHLKPDEEQLWQEDLRWARSLLAKSRELTAASSSSSSAPPPPLPPLGRFLDGPPGPSVDVGAEDFGFDDDEDDDTRSEPSSATPAAPPPVVDATAQLNPNAWIRFRPSDS